MTVRITVPTVGEETTYIIGEGTDPQNHRFFLVRGDFAVGLSAEQVADSTRLYIWNWRDESPPLSKGTGPRDLSAEQSLPAGEHLLTWGELKAISR